MASLNCRQVPLWRKWMVVGGGLFAAGLVGPVAWASDDQIVVEYHAPQGCPARDQFDAEILARTDRIRMALRDASRRFRAEIVEVDARYAGHLYATTQGAESEPRRITSSSCAEVASALALMIAVAVDPNAKTDPIEQLVVSPVASAPRSPPTVDPPPVATLRPPAHTPTAAAAGDSRWGSGLGRGGMTIWGIAPNTSLGVMPYYEGRVARTPQMPTWHLRAGVGYADSLSFASDAALAAVHWSAIRVEACPEISFDSRFSMLACLALDTGAIWAEGRNVAHPSSKVGLYAAAGPLLELQLSLSQSFGLAAYGGPMFAISRSDLVFDGPRQVVYEAPWLVGSVGIAAIWRMTPL